MPEYLAPGVYVEEIDAGAKPIEGVSTSTAGFIGMTERGPITGKPLLVTSFADYQRKFGGYLPESLGTHRFLPHAVRGFFENGGQRVYIRRVAKDALAAQGTPANGMITRLRENLSGGAGVTTAALESAAGINPTDDVFITRCSGGATSSFTAPNLTGVDNTANTITWDAADEYRGADVYDTQTTVVTSAAHLTTLTADIGAGAAAADLDSAAGLNNGNVLLFVKRTGGVTETHEVTLVAAPAGNSIDFTGTEIPAGMTFEADTTLVFLAPVAVLTALTTPIDAALTTTVTLASLCGIEVGTVLTLNQDQDGVITGPHNLTVTAYDAAQSTVTWAGAETPGPGVLFDFRYASVTVDGIAEVTPVRFEAADPGEWGNDISVQISHSSLASAPVLSLSEGSTAGEFNVVELRHVNGFYTGAIVEFDRGETKAYGRITDIQGNNIIIAKDAPLFNVGTALDPDGGGTTMARTCEFGVAVSYLGAQENHSPLTLDEKSPYFYEELIGNNSSLIVASGGPALENQPFNMPSGGDGLNVSMAGGDNGATPGDAEYVGADNGPGNRTGIQAMVDIDQVSIVAVPGITDLDILNALVIHCELLKDRFAIIDPDYTRNNPLDTIQNFRNNFDTKYGAVYFPSLSSSDPVTERPITLPPSGHMAGIYARTDVERGVHKAPANTVVRGITGLDLTINKGEQDILNPININVIRDFRADQRGMRVWGSRCLTSDSAWKYVPVRRLFIFVEESLDEGLQWVVFEPNDEKLWARVIQTISNFLRRVWRDGALMGLTEPEAFFVRCDRTTMTQDDIDNGRLIVQVGIAPVKPAEFVIIRIQQYTAEANQ